MTGGAIGGQPLSEAGLRQALTELGGPRPGGVRPDAAGAAARPAPARATRP